MSVNLDGTFLGCKHGLALLKQRGGAIVNVSSVAGLIGGHNFAAYNASKGGVRLLSKSVALHGARLNPQVRCNSIHPAFLEGPMVDQMLRQTNFPDAARARITRDIPLGRLGTAGGGRRYVRLSVVGRVALRHRRRIRHRRRLDRALISKLRRIARHQFIRMLPSRQCLDAVEPGRDIAGQHKNIAAWLDRIKALPGWKHPYELMPGYPPVLA